MSTVVDPNEIKGTTARLATLLARLDLGSCVPATVAELVGLGEQIERLGHGLKTEPPPTSPRPTCGAATATVPPRTGWPGTPARPRRMPGGWSRRVGSSRRCRWLPRRSPAGSSPPGRPKPSPAPRTANPGAQSRLIDKAKSGTLRELQDVCRRTRVNAEPDPDAAARQVHAKRSYRSWTDADGITGHLHMTGPMAEIARADNAIRQPRRQGLPRGPRPSPPRAGRGLRLRRHGRAPHPHRPGGGPTGGCGRQDHRPGRPHRPAPRPRRGRGGLRDRRGRPHPRAHRAPLARRRLPRRRRHQG